MKKYYIHIEPKEMGGYLSFYICAENERKVLVEISEHKIMDTIVLEKFRICIREVTNEN